MIGEKVLWAGRECEILEESADMGIVKIRKLDGTEDGPVERRVNSYAGIWLRNECIEKLNKDNKNAQPT